MLGMFTLISSRYCLARRRIFCFDSQPICQRSVLAVEEQVEVNGQLWDQGEVLVNGLDAVGRASLTTGTDFFAFEEDLPRSGR